MKRFLPLLIFTGLLFGQNIFINEFLASNNYFNSDEYGEFDDWVELANTSNDTINLFGWFISDNESNLTKHQFTDSLYIYSDSLLLLWADEDQQQGSNHLNFKLSSGGEEIFLTNPSYIIIDSVFFGQQTPDVSYGRYPNYTGFWGFMSVPTPGGINLPHDSTEYSPDVIVIPESGFYDDSIYVTLFSDSADADIYYTLNGSVPDTNSFHYTEPLLLIQSTVIRLITIRSGFQPSLVQTHNFILDSDFNLPTIALTVNPSVFPIGSGEYNVHVAYFKQDGSIGFACDAGIERHSNNILPQQPYRISFKPEYGTTYINYPIFENRENHIYKRLILRNAGNDMFPPIPPNLVGNGSFDSNNVLGWSSGASAVISLGINSQTGSGYSMVVTNGGSGYSYAYQTLTTEVGGLYYLTWYRLENLDDLGSTWKVEAHTGSTVLATTSGSTSGGTWGPGESMYFEATTTTTQIRFYKDNADSGGVKFDEITCFEYISDSTAAIVTDNRAHLRDVISHSLYENIQPNAGFSAFKSVHVYINGIYWGIYHLRERQDKHYIEELFGHEDIDLLERAYQWGAEADLQGAIEGDWIAYDSLEYFIENSDMTLETNFQYLKENIYYEEFIDYWMFEIFIGNYDWPNNNIKFWRPRSGEDKWRWLLWDTDHGLGMELNEYEISWGDPATDYLEWSTGLEGPHIDMPQQGWVSNRIIKGILINNEGRIDFINRFADLLNTNLSYLELLAVIDSLANILDPDMQYHTDRWNGDLADWHNGVENIRNYALERQQHIKNHIKNKFDLDSTFQVSLDLQPFSSGIIQINSINIHSFPWTGTYFSNVPIEISLIPYDGYELNHWDGTNNSSYTLILDSLVQDTTISAILTPISNHSLVINEINYNSASDFDTGDWVELYNNSDSSINISDWQFKDSDNSHVFTIPSNTILQDSGFIVLCKDTTSFKSLFPEVENYIGNFDFGLSGSGELIRLYHSNGVLLDQVTYDDEDPWPVEADGGGPTLELINPSFDNTLPENWNYSNNLYGTPGSNNSIYLDLTAENILSIPKDYMLHQNYPNPFNPITTLRYDLPEQATVNIIIYDMLGRQVRTLLNQTQDAGYRSVIWNATNDYGKPVSAGVYLYKIQAGSFVQTKKMVLLK